MKTVSKRKYWLRLMTKQASEGKDRTKAHKAKKRVKR